MKIERAWRITGKSAIDAAEVVEEKFLEPWKEINEERAGMDLANVYGNEAVEKLKKEKVLATRFGQYRIVE